MVKVAGAINKSSECMKSMNQLLKVGAMHEGMQNLAKEMMKAGLIEEMVDDVMDEASGVEEGVVDAEVEQARRLAFSPCLRGWLAARCAWVQPHAHSWRSAHSGPAQLPFGRRCQLQLFCSGLCVMGDGGVQVMYEVAGESAGAMPQAGTSRVSQQEQEPAQTEEVRLHFFGANNDDCNVPSG